MVKASSSTVELPLILIGSSSVKVGGIDGVAVKCADIRRNTGGEGGSLGNN